VSSGNTYRLQWGLVLFAVAFFIGVWLLVDSFKSPHSEVTKNRYNCMDLAANLGSRAAQGEYKKYCQ